MTSTVNDELHALGNASEDDLWRQLGEAVLAGPDGERYEYQAAGLGGRQTRSERAVAAAHAEAAIDEARRLELNEVAAAA